MHSDNYISMWSGSLLFHLTIAIEKEDVSIFISFALDECNLRDGALHCDVRVSESDGLPTLQLTPSDYENL